MRPLHTLPARLVLTYAAGYMAPMATMWFLAPALQGLLERRGVDIGNAWHFEWWLGLVPYPVPFTARAGVGVALVVVPPIAFILACWQARRRVSRREGPRQ